jgi:hypothetical protein
LPAPTSVRKVSGIHPPHKHHVTYFWDINSRRQQIYCHRNLGIDLIFKAANQLQRLIGISGNLQHRVIFDATILVFQSNFQLVNHNIGMIGINAENQRFSR